MRIGINSVGAYIPYYFMKRETIGDNWEGRGQKGNRSVANVDEDSLTMAVDAAMSCFQHIKRKDINALYFASTTAPYAEKSNSCLIATACDLSHDIFATDFAHSTRAGTNALKAACDLASAHHGQNALVVAADSRNAYPKSEYEQLLGDAAVAFTIGSENVLATFNHFTTINSEIVDIWRNEGDKYLSIGEGRFINDAGYMKAMTAVIKKVFAETGLQASDISRVVVSTPGLKEQNSLLKKAGFSEDQLQDPYMLSVGNCGTAQTFMGLAGALENANPGEKILLVDYGNGANALLFTATEKVNDLKGMRVIDRFLETQRELCSYSRFLSFRGIVEAAPGAPFKLPASASMTWREQDSNIRLHASKCNQCGAAIFPINRICFSCGSKDDFDQIRVSERITKVFTFSIDNYAGRSDDPVLVQTVSEDEDGIRYYHIMTDFNISDVTAGMDVEFTFRKMHTLGNFNNYYWKVRPVRREVR